MRPLVMIALLASFAATLPARADKRAQLLPEFSALLLDDRFDSTLQDVRQAARRQKLELRADATLTLDIGQQHWVYLGFSKRPAGSSRSWLPFGNIVGQYRVVNGGFEMDGVYFQPAAEPPPAAGGGN